MIMAPSVERRWLPDAVLALVLFAAVVAYLTAMPLNLQSPDEARHLDHAKRLLDGEVLYRDVFDITTPGWVLLMTATFAVFGTTLSVARIVAAIIQGCIAVAIFAICRRLGVRRILAAPCACVGVVICDRIFSGATYNWLASLLSIALVLLCLIPTRAVRWAFVIGVDLGLLIAVHQNRGAMLAVGIGAFFMAQRVIDWLHGDVPPRGTLWRQLLAIAGGGAMVLIPLLAAVIAKAGIDPVWDCLVMVPLMNYRPALTAPWGYSWGGSTAGILVVRYVPFAIVPTACIAIALSWPRDKSEAARQHVLLTVLGAASLLSIAYFPDIVHLALIAPLFLSMLANLVERALNVLPQRTDRALGTAIGIAVLLFGSVRAYETVREKRLRYHVPYDSAFGRIDLPGQYQFLYYTQLRELVDSIPGRILYVHPVAVYTNLLVGARNPTRYDLVLAPVYTKPSQMREVIAALASKHVPYVLLSPRSRQLPGEDLVTFFILEHYDRASKPYPLQSSLWKLKQSDAGDR